MRKLFAALLAGLVLAEPCFATEPGPEERLKTAVTALEKHTGDFGGLDGKPGDVDALSTLWTETQAYVAAKLDRHISPKIIEKQAPALSSYYGGLHVVPIGPNLFAISANAGPLGNVFISGKQNGHFTTLWDIRRSPMGTTPWGWNREAAQGKCLHCRSAWGSVTALPPDSAGHARFYIDARYAQDAGATQGAQLSIWRFNGRTADVLLKKNYIVVADDENGPSDKGPSIRRHNKREYRMLFACGSCLGRTMIWTIKVTPEGVADQGEIPEVPEADVIDEVFFRLWYGKDARTLARPEVLSQMSAIVVGAKKARTDPKFPTLGMVMATSAARLGRQTVVTLSTDVDSAPVMRFAVDHTKSGSILTKLEISQEIQRGN